MMNLRTEMAAMDFPQHSQLVLEQLNQQRHLGVLCDCTFVVDGTDFKAHKAVLAACSQYFRMLFVEQKDVVHLDISNAAGLSQVLEFMYTAQLNLNRDNVEDVLAVAGFLQMQEIVNACMALKSLSMAEPEGTHSMAAPEGTFSMAPPEGTHSLGSPEGTHSLGAPEGTHSLGAPEETDSMATPDGMHSMVAPEGAHSLVVPEGTHSLGALSSSQEVIQPESEISAPPLAGETDLESDGADQAVYSQDEVSEDGGGEDSQVTLEEEDANAATPQGAESSGEVDNREVSPKMEVLVDQVDWTSSDQKEDGVAVSQSQAAERQTPQEAPEKPPAEQATEHIPTEIGDHDDDIGQETGTTTDEDVRTENEDGVDENAHGGNNHVPDLTGAIRQLRSASANYSERTESRQYSSTTHTCEYCNKEFTHTGNYTRHIRIHTGEKPYRCQECDKAFSDPAACKAHEKTHSPLKPHGCDDCGKSYRLVSLLNLHKKRHSGEPSYFCKICGKLFTTSGNLKRHQLVHSGEKPYMCEYCDRPFSDPTSKMRHLETHDTNKEHKCPHCDKKFNQLGNLKAHLKVHIADGPLKCRVCAKQFTTSGNLKRHLRIHSGEKPYVCVHCKRKFADPGALQRHVRTHTGEKPCLCVICGKAFTQASSLIAHVRQHTGEKPYVCERCGKRFVQSSQLANHIRHHDNIRPHKCTECNKAFVNVGDLTKHIIIHTGEKPYLCDKCGRGFNRVDNLRSHVKTVHKGKAGMKFLNREEDEVDEDEINIVTVAPEMVALAAGDIAGTGVTELTVVPISASVTADETEALKAEISKAVKQVQEADPNTQILYACDSCGDKFLDANCLAEHVRMHTAQALVMFQSDTDLYQQYNAQTTWHTEQVVQSGELLFRQRDGAEVPPQPMECQSPGE